MGFYQNQIVPFLIDFAMRQRNLVAYRSRIVSAEWRTDNNGRCQYI